MDADISGMNLTKLKLDLLCHGITMDDRLKEGLIPRYRYKRASLSEGRCFQLEYEGRTTVINLAVYEKFAQSSPYRYDHEKRGLFFDGNSVCKMVLVDDPEWYLYELGDGTMWGSQIQLHGTGVLATSLSSYCVFKDKNEGCGFCGMTLDKDNRAKDPKKLAAVLAAIEKKYPGVFHELNVNSGTSLNDDRGAEMFLETIKEIRKASDVLIAAQIAPMEDFSWVDRLKDAGLSSLSFNLEIWDNDVREKIMPGKGRIPRELYLDILEYAGKVFGGVNVSSWLIGGLEPPESTIQGAEQIARRGVLPFVTVFRPLIGSTMENEKPPDIETMIKIYKELKSILGKYGLDPQKADTGCAKCDCCAAGREVLTLGV
ncbi:MAG: radical SAM protein [Candidatus Desulfatibia sp.]|uniref:radical SAM protein n=1 Tax=Candidatus Desulfatibia sp. TaxID=3101189 RepID=UPI002F2BF3A3